MFKITENKSVFEKSISEYADLLKKEAYIKSFRAAGQNNALMEIAEEDMKDYFKQIGWFTTTP